MFDPKERFRNPGLLRWPAGSTRKSARSSCARPTYLVYAPRCSGARTAVHRRVTSLHIASDESRTAPIPFRCRHLVPVINTRRVTVEAGLHTVSVSQVTVNIDGIGLAFDATLAVGAQRARDVSRAHDMPVRVVDEEVLLIEGSHTACCWRKFSLRLPLALLGDASSTPSYGSAVRFGTCSC